jgi:hypothetical protein
MCAGHRGREWRLGLEHELPLTTLADQGDPSVGEMVHPDLGHRVEVNFEGEAEAEEGSKRSVDDWLAEQEPILWELVSGGRFPNFADLLMRTPFDFDLDTLFEFGLQRLLDGYAVLPAKAG